MYFTPFFKALNLDEVIFSGHLGQVGCGYIPAVVAAIRCYSAAMPAHLPPRGIHFYPRCHQRWTSARLLAHCTSPHPELKLLFKGGPNRGQPGHSFALTLPV